MFPARNHTITYLPHNKQQLVQNYVILGIVIMYTHIYVCTAHFYKFSGPLHSWRDALAHSMRARRSRDL